MNCGWCGRDSGHSTGCKKPRLASKAAADVWLLKLDTYQLANLLWLLDLVQTVEPFSFAANGDWIGEITNMLEYVKDGSRKEGGWFTPNSSDTEVMEQLRVWTITASVMES